MLNSTVELRLDVKKILRAEYHRLGIFLDSRCDHSRYRRILIDVSNLSFEILKHHNIDVCNNVMMFQYCHICSYLSFILYLSSNYVFDIFLFLNIIFIIKINKKLFKLFKNY